MPFNPKILIEVMDVRGVNATSLSDSLKISRERFSDALRGERIPTKNQIFKISSLLAVPAYAFFMDDFKVDHSEITDFRTRKPVMFKFGLYAGKFEGIFRLRDYLAELYKRLDIDAPQALISEQADENPEQFAATIAKLLSVHELQKRSKTKKEFYNLLREKIEDLGVFVMQDHYLPEDIDGVALYHANFSSNMIYVNSSKRNHGAKTFTLAHELAHILGKRSAVSDNYKFRNEIERFCNRFAASLLIPRDLFFATVEQKRLTFSDYNQAVESAKTISSVFKTSISAALVRAVELGLAENQYYVSFAAGFGSPEFLDTLKPKSGGGSDDGPEPGIIDLATFGKRAVAVINEALASNKTTEYEVFKKTGLSRRRISGLQSISAKKNLVIESGNP
ncbi:ImmA/IrrE family metallo-endopeptidase [bacterium M00.F.Ca.ET.194.01.1.1]|uniref:ImmA/IrrE family metallo-endopeptidase n=1 Tax=Agrobacterium pusense TaxID=648995 RepID=UPI001091D106|nr:ImmA/IrrE family metallo-endopeptidase [Agrobacterium pusense]TGR70917.1 ImmA/IrrE family metallo-endopeptidase [bacterium M00.F.Ca.ET.194.01.1.1]TGS55769.1 ImmA/IrrE family metallo-endopeptidase [bacterium M00.F.Ca.ET.179.01.1.1]TGV48679.1 ImmA/IrrE family metallo-endopeptidase [bacterium M00.F.Ca.ET.168.01.1.1]